ncbi:MAG: alpha/beta hydrolase [Verrucomicrobiota bacterium]
MTRLLVMVASAVVFLAMFAHIMASGAMFKPRLSSYKLETEAKGEGELPVQIVELGSGGKIATYHKVVRPEALTVVYFHGNAEDIGDSMAILSTLQLRGFNVATMDYRGYGLSEGEASERNVYADAGAFLDFLIEDKGVEESKIVVMGRSLGGAPAIKLASDYEVAGLIVESSFKSIYSLLIPIQFVPGDKFRNASKISDVNCPTLIIHGEKDRVVPVEHGRELAARSGATKLETLWLEDAGHNDVALVGGAAYRGTIRKIL